MSKHLLTKCIISKTHYDFIPPIEEKDCFQITRIHNSSLKMLKFLKTFLKYPMPQCSHRQWAGVTKTWVLGSDIAAPEFVHFPNVTSG